MVATRPGREPRLAAQQKRAIRSGTIQTSSAGSGPAMVSATKAAMKVGAEEGEAAELESGLGRVGERGDGARGRRS